VPIFVVGGVVAVPDYQSLMAPVLHALSDGETRTMSQLREIVAAQLGLSTDDRKQTITSGAPLYDNRLAWAVTYINQAGLVRRPRRGIVEITERGRAVLEEHPDQVDNNLLDQFDEFRDFRNRARGEGRATIQPSPEKDATPRETIGSAVAEANNAVAAEILDRIREHDPAFLEHLVLQVLTAMGYGGAAGSAEHLGRSGDEGLDGVIKQDTLGLDRIYVQAKRYSAERTVGRPEIQEFVGALHGAQADRGIFITTSRFSPEARSYSDRVAARLVLIDGQTLASLMVDHNIGAQDRETYVIKRVDEDFFEDA
jgi:restriction system protein